MSDKFPNGGMASALGTFFQNWAILDVCLKMYLANLLMTDQFRGGMVWSSHNNFQTKLRLLNRLSKTFLDDPELSEVLRRLGKVEELTKFRNELAHDNYVFDDDNQRITFAAPNPHFHAEFKSDWAEQRHISYEDFAKQLNHVIELAVFFGSRGNLPPINDYRTLGINRETKFHRTIRKPPEGGTDLA